jgi:hypothetical protein
MDYQEQYLPIMTNPSLEQKARRVAKRAGLVARKSRWRAHSLDNFGGFQIVEPYFNCIEEGMRFDMSAEEVIKYCEGHEGMLAGELK